ncbi:MAG: hypothetical protein AB1327_12260, partial [Bacillota bacterium]
RQKALPDNVQGQVRVMVGLGYAPAEVADRLGLRRSDVMRFLRDARSKRWPGLYEALSPEVKEEFLRWRHVVDGARAALPGWAGPRAKVIPFELKMIRYAIMGTILALNSLPWWERFPPHPEVLRRLGIPNAYRVAVEMDARAVSLATYADLLTSQLYREALGSVYEATGGPWTRRPGSAPWPTSTRRSASPSLRTRCPICPGRCVTRPRRREAAAPSPWMSFGRTRRTLRVTRKSRR